MDQESPEFAYLTTRGRETAEPHTVELWYRRDGPTVWLIAGVNPPIEDGRPDWLRNLEADARTRVQIGADTFGATARFIDGDQTVSVRRAFLERYSAWVSGQPMPAWAAKGRIVVLDLDPN